MHAKAIAAVPGAALIAVADAAWPTQHGRPDGRSNMAETAAAVAAAYGADSRPIDEIEVSADAGAAVRLVGTGAAMPLADILANAG